MGGVDDSRDNKQAQKGQQHEGTGTGTANEQIRARGEHDAAAQVDQVACGVMRIDPELPDDAADQGDDLQDGLGPVLDGHIAGVAVHVSPIVVVVQEGQSAGVEPGNDQRQVAERDAEADDTAGQDGPGHRGAEASTNGAEVAALVVVTLEPEHRCCDQKQGDHEYVHVRFASELHVHADLFHRLGAIIHEVCHVHAPKDADSHDDGVQGQSDDASGLAHGSLSFV